MTLPAGTAGCWLSKRHREAANAITTSSASSREAFRQFLTATMAGVGAVVQAELQRKVDPAAGLSFASLAAADVASRARAYRTMVDAATPTPGPDARRLAGLT